MFDYDPTGHKLSQSAFLLFSGLMVWAAGILALAALG